MNTPRQLSPRTDINLQPISGHQSDYDDDEPYRSKKRRDTSTSISTLDSIGAQSTATGSLQTILVSSNPLSQQLLRNMQDSRTTSPTPYIARGNESSVNDLTAQGKFWKWFKRTHFKNYTKPCRGLILFRTLSILGLIGYTIIDIIMYSTGDLYKSPVLQFLHGSRYLALEIFTIVYASGVAAFGISVEIYALVPYIISTTILASRNCGGPIVITSIFWILKVVFLLIAIEVTHHNFTKFEKYDDNFKSSSRAMLRQALWFSITMLFLSAPGLRALYNGINRTSVLFCPYDISHCGIVELYEPQFTYDNDKCLNDIKEYVTGREQLRVLRNFMLLNGVSYAIFNCNFLDIQHSKQYFCVRVLLILLYTGLATSVLASYIDTLYFIQKCRLPYNIIELIIFTILFVLPAFNLVKIRRIEGRRQSTVSIELANPPGQLIPSENNMFHHQEMEKSPKILPSS